MANYINKYLRQAGVKVPGDDMTEAQIEEQNKANPLASFGIQSAQQKQQRLMAQQIQEAQMKAQQEALQAQLIARMSSQEKIGHYSGAGLMGLMSYLKNRNAAPEQPNPSPQNDAELDRFNQLALEVGPETAMKILAQETGNAGMAQEAERMRMASDKAKLEAQYKGSQISANEALVAERQDKLADPNRAYEHKPGYTEEVDVMMDGKPAVQKRVLIKNTPDGGEWKYSKPALKGSVTDPKAWETSKGGINERTKAMESALKNTADAMDIYDRLEKLAQETPAGLGWTGALAGKADMAVHGIKNMADELTRAGDIKVTASMDPKDYKFGSLDKVGAASDKIKSLQVQLAYSKAAANGDSSRSISDRDIQNQIDAMGGAITNPQSFLELIKQNKELMVGSLENMAKYSRIDGQPIFGQYRSDIEGLKQRIGVTGFGDMINQKYGSEEAALKRLRELEAKHKGK